MKNKILTAFGVCIITLSPAMAQPPAPAPAIKDAMSKVSWMIGEWKGEGWRASPDGAVITFNVSEVVEPKLDGLVLLIEGRGWNETDDGARIVGHHALGVFSYDAFAQRYIFDAFVKEGYQSRSHPTIGENQYSWSHQAGPGAEMRFTAQLTEDGAWLETGEYCREDVCRKSLEMRLERVD